MAFGKGGDLRKKPGQHDAGGATMLTNYMYYDDVDAEVRKMRESAIKCATKRVNDSKMASRQESALGCAMRVEKRLRMAGAPRGTHLDRVVAPLW